MDCLTGMRSFYACIFFALLSSPAFAQTPVSGYVTDARSGEVLIGASVYTSDHKTGSVTNSYGYYSLRLTASDTLFCSYLGYTSRQILTGSETALNIRLSESPGSLKEVEIRAKPRKQNTNTHLQLDLNQLQQLPAMGGERDLMKAVQLMPGVKRGADGTTGLLVRGGNNDQNLILLDDAPVYNPGHLLGFFSLFNTDAIKEATLQTGAFTANYGGRLSSVLDVRTKDGNRHTTGVSGQVGMLATKLCIEGPLFRGRGSYLIAGRISYANKLFELAGKEMPFWFYDFSSKVSYDMGKRDKFFLSYYQGDDIQNTTRKDTSGLVNLQSKLGNEIGSIRWNHSFSGNTLYSNLTLFKSRYRYWINGGFNSNSIELSARILDYGMRYQFQQRLSERVNLNYGCELIQHHFLPGTVILKGKFNENISAESAPQTELIEGASYFNAGFQLSQRLFCNAGFRYSAAIVASAKYHTPEPRISLRYQLSPFATFHASWSQMVQYMFQLSGSSAIFPTELWYGISESIRPQQAQVFTLGYTRSSGSHTSRIETYFKPMQNLVEYREGAVSLGANNPDEILLQGKGLAYGLEWSHRFTQGKLDISSTYSLSWSNRTFAGLNEGRTFHARYDRRHDFNIILNYALTKRLAISSVWTFASGSWFTPVVGRFMMPNGNYTGVDLLPVYSARNAVQLANAHKLDINLMYSGKGAKYSYTWHIGAYNVYNQTQPYRIKTELNPNGTYKYTQVGLFGFIPSIGYQFNF